VHHYNSTQYCKTETVFSIFPFLQTNITSQMWPCGGNGGYRYIKQFSDVRDMLYTHVSVSNDNDKSTIYTNEIIQIRKKTNLNTVRAHDLLPRNAAELSLVFIKHQSKNNHFGYDIRRVYQCAVTQTA